MSLGPNDAEVTMALTGRRLAFVTEYAVDQCATQAAIRAGFSPNGANRAGSRLLKEAGVAAAIAAERAARAERNRVDADWVLERLKRIADANMLDFAAVQADGSAVTDMTHVTRDQAYAIGEMTTEEYMDGAGRGAREMKSVKLKLKDSLRALELIGKNLGMWTEKVDVNHGGAITVVLNGDDANL